MSGANTWCQQFSAASGSEACNLALHERVAFGRSSGFAAAEALWPVPPEASIQSMAVAALKKLPWGARFLSCSNNGTMCEPAWPKIIMAGHSQGCGHAAYISYRRPVKGQVHLGGPQECPTCGGWLKQMADVPSRGPIRLLWSYHEECGPVPMLPKTYCPMGLMVDVGHLMGLPYIEWDGGPPPVGRDMSIANTALQTSFPGNTREFHNMNAWATCAVAGTEVLWKQLFSF